MIEMPTLRAESERFPTIQTETAHCLSHLATSTQSRMNKSDANFHFFIASCQLTQMMIGDEPPCPGTVLMMNGGRRRSCPSAGYPRLNRRRKSARRREFRPVARSRERHSTCRRTLE